jgi:hypothetical protein
MRVEAYHEHFALDNVADGEWLKFVGMNGWVALSHNKKIRYEKDELDDLMGASVKAFFIIGKGPHTVYADAVLRNLRKIIGMIQRYPEPFVARVYQEQNDVKLWVTYEEWLRGRRLGR